jgi:hypothetical protein
MTPEDLAKITAIRAKCAEGTATSDEVRWAVDILRQGRLTSVAKAPAKSTTKATKAPVDANALLNDLLK